MSKWVEMPLGEVADFVMGQSPDSAAVSELPGGLPFLQGCAEFGRRTPEAKFYVNPSLRIAPKGSSLISVRAPVGTINDADQSYGIGRGLAAVIGKKRSNQFLRYAIELNSCWLHRRSQGSTFLAIGSDDLRKLPIKTSNNTHICEAAAKVIATIDIQIEATEELIAKQERVRAGLMRDLFTRGIDEHGQLRPRREQAPHLYHQTELGWLPLGWEVDALQNLATTDITYGIVQAGPHVPGGIPYIRTGDMSGESLDRESLLCTTPAIAANFQRSRVQSGEIVIAIRATIGKALVVPTELDGANLTQGTARFSSNSKLEQKFALRMLRCRQVNLQIALHTKGTTFSEITLADLRTVIAPFPTDLGEQRRISQTLDAIDKQLEQLRLERSKLHLQKSGLMQDLLTGKVSVAPLLESAAA